MIMKIKTPEKYEDLYFCNPKKNVNCSKMACYIHGGPCYCTTNKRFKKLYFIGYLRKEINKWFADLRK